jgi:hypothetical protein
VRMMGDGTYIGMMNEFQENQGVDWDGLGRPLEEQQDTQVYTTPTTQGQKKPRNKNFCEMEVVALVRAWLHTSIDAIPRINQKHGDFWTRIHNFYHAAYGMHAPCTRKKTKKRSLFSSFIAGIFYGTNQSDIST